MVTLRKRIEKLNEGINSMLTVLEQVVAKQKVIEDKLDNLCKKVESDELFDEEDTAKKLINMFNPR